MSHTKDNGPVPDGTRKSVDQYDEMLDAQDRVVDRPIRLEDLQVCPEALRDGDRWQQALRWCRVDAIAWIARRDPELMKLIRGYRAFMRIRHADFGDEIIERACRTVLFSHIGEECWEAERGLLTAERDGVVRPLDDGLPPIVAKQCRSIFPALKPNVEKATVKMKRAAHRPEKRTEALRIFRVRVVSGQTNQNRAEEARAINKAWSIENKPQQKTTSAYLAPYYAGLSWCDGRLVDSLALLSRIDGDKVDKVA